MFERNVVALGFLSKNVAVYIGVRKIKSKARMTEASLIIVR